MTLVSKEIVSAASGRQDIGLAEMPAPAATRKSAGISWPVQCLLIQIALSVVFLLGWQYLPTIKLLSQNIKVFDSFFISSPTAVARDIVGLMTGENDNRITLWPFLWTTVVATVLGTSIGLILGALAGLLVSNSEKLGDVTRPFLVIANSIPRVAIIPIFVVLAGPTLAASVISIVAVVFFVAFFNALEGGRSIQPAILENAKLLGAGDYQIMRSIRLPMVLTWTFAAIPNAISFGLIVAVTTELLAGIPGMGALLLSATANIQAGLTFAIIVILSVVGLCLYWGTTAIRNRVIHWR
ncbi:ABC transporter permease subunit [Bradyrhizobium sp. 187]|uniref:ABC transporter permease n=1 Tax=Bradyrhizobium sp. 187 TaxID=2782655 RepID=UPI001FFFF33C|nr:ABC transporter permease subunit [Bradyrhizobium sp. 187]UPJ71834.1 ABC transporter permease subunit [Bradyrhizobium sp. 187]